MSTLGLSAADKAAFTRALSTDREVVQEVRVLDLSHRFISTVTPMVLDGQVNYTGGTGISRTLQMGFFDPDHALHLDADAPSEGVVGMNRLIQVITHVRVPELNRWVALASFTGRPSKLDRDGDTVTLEADSKECLHLRGVSATHIPKGTNYVTAIKTLLKGEIRFRFPTGITRKTTTNLNYGGSDEEMQPWLRARKMAGGLGMQLFYDADGYVVMRKAPTQAEWTLTEQGDGANMTARMKRTTDLTAVRNRVVVTGQVGGKAFTVTDDAAKLDPKGPYTAAALATNGVGWSNTAFEEQSDMNTRAKVTSYARLKLGEYLTESTTLTGGIVPVWHLEPGDLVRMNLLGAGFDFRWSEASIPLGPSGDATVGHISRVRAPTAGRIGA